MLLFALSLGVTAPLLAQTKKYHGVSFNTELKLDGENLVINGAGLRENTGWISMLRAFTSPKRQKMPKK